VGDHGGGVGTMAAVGSERASEAGRDVIALDGPSGTGKSTVARGLARRLGFRYLDTGAMYRAVTWAVLREGVDPEDAAAVTDLAGRTRITVTIDPDDQHVTVDGHRVDREIRSNAVTTAVSPVSAAPGVRALLVAQQRELIGPGAVVVEGRDIGTVVAPDAPLKIFLTASPGARATRRSRQDGTDRTGTAADLDRRDAYDSSRAHSPLRAAADAVHLDTTTMRVDEVIQRLVDLAKEREIAPADVRPGT
jgi:CMP/dCMP kinase